MGPKCKSTQNVRLGIKCYCCLDYLPISHGVRWLQDGQQDMSRIVTLLHEYSIHIIRRSVTAILRAATSHGHRHFVIIECRHLANGCVIKCSCIGLMVFRATLVYSADMRTTKSSRWSSIMSLFPVSTTSVTGSR